MIKYPPKILVGLSLALKGNKEICDWFTKNDYYELAAFTSAIKDSCEKGGCDALAWLIKHKYNTLAALCDAIDDNVEAYNWLKKHKHREMAIMVLAVKGDRKSYDWLDKNNKVLHLIVQNIIVIKKKELMDRKKGKPLIDMVKFYK